MRTFHDPVTGRPLSAPDHITLPDEIAGETVQDIADTVFAWLDEAGAGVDGHPPADVPDVDHARDSFVTDHLLLTSALAYCLGYEHEIGDVDLHLLRLAALGHECADRERLAEALPAHAAFLRAAWQHLDQQAARLEEALGQDDSLLSFEDIETPGDVRLAILVKAHLTASDRLHTDTWPDPRTPEDERRRIRSLSRRVDVARHPLVGDDMIGLVFGGATKIKSYVFESARLPEVRGASTLFDRINTLDVPALWGRMPREDEYGTSDLYDLALKRYDDVRTLLEEADDRISLPPAAPECVLYASGGNTLAFAPPSIAAPLADLIERLYTRETLTGNSVAVHGTFGLIEVQYGRRPDEYWLDDFLADVEAHEELLASYYKGTTASHFVARKGFGELGVLLATEALRRRAGGEENSSDDRISRAIPHYELLPQTIKCHSCDTRPAVIALIDLEQGERDDTPAGQSPKVFCDACARKRVAGQVAKRDQVATRWFTNHIHDWYPDSVTSWEVKFAKFVRTGVAPGTAYRRDGPVVESVLAANDVQEIGYAATPPGYVGYIYADGNDIGALFERIATPAAYRQFSRRLYIASEHAVFSALAHHLQPCQLEETLDPDRPDRRGKWVHPFEIITIGGDDLIIIVPGDRTMEIAVSIAEVMRDRFSGPCPRKDDGWTPQQKWDHERYPLRNGTGAEMWTDEAWPAISISAGVVVARDHTPIPYVSELAEQLQKSAKRARKTGVRAHYDEGADETRPYPGGTVDFSILKSTGMVSLPWKHYRRRAFGIDEDHDRVLTARPYTWHEFEGLIRTVRKLKEAGFPRSQMYRLQEDLEAGRLAATINYLYFLSHLEQGRSQHVLMEEFHTAWHDTGHAPPWRKLSPAARRIYNEERIEEEGDVEKMFETIWRDVIELYDFVTREDDLSDETDGA